ncbi:MAG: transglycosylase SLT domain-containing protein [Burkholderiaceae bacterium]
MTAKPQLRSWWTAWAVSALLAGCALPGPQSVGEASAGATDAAAEVPDATPREALLQPPPSAAEVEPDAADKPAAAEVVDTLRPETRVDFDDPVARSDLWTRIRQGYGVVDVDNALVRKWERYYLERPDYMARMHERGGRYLFHVVEELRKRDMPLDLALLPFIESAFNPQATSVARAAGMWQFMPSTGRGYALHQNMFRDDRRDVLASTRAALDYLQRLKQMFNGDWQLALAAYNWGEGNVKRALTRKRDPRAATAYLGLQGVPIETRNYVPKFQAIKNIVARPQAFDIALPPLQNHPYFLTVSITRDIDAELAARLAGVTLEEFQFLNPQLNKPVILAALTPQVLLPYEGANAFVRNLPQHTGALASWTVWVAPRTLKPAAAAEMVNMSEAELRDVNGIPPNMLIQAGSSLLVPRPEDGANDVSAKLAAQGQLLLAPDGALRRVSFRAGRHGDSVAAVARRYHVSATQVAHWNGVAADAAFRPRQNIVVMVPAKARTAAPARPAVKTASAARRRQ